jgi:hypothetical protein
MSLKLMGWTVTGLFQFPKACCGRTTTDRVLTWQKFTAAPTDHISDTDEFLSLYFARQFCAILH